MPNPDSMDLPPSANERDEPHVSSEPDGRLLIAVAIVSVLSPLLLPAIVESISNFDGILRLLGELVFCIAMGSYFVGPLICCIFLALSKFSLSDRWAWTVGLSLGWLLIYTFGIGAIYEGFEVSILLAVPSFLLAIVLPFFALRSFLGWQISLRQDELPTRQSLKVSDLMRFTATVSVAIALPQLSEYWAETLLASIVLFCLSLIVLVPVVYLLMRQDGYWNCLMVLCVAVGFMALAQSVFGDFPDPRLVIALVSAIGTFGLALVGIRIYGCKLLTHSDIVSLPENPTATSEKEKDNDPFR